MYPRRDVRKRLESSKRSDRRRRSRWGEQKEAGPAAAHVDGDSVVLSTSSISSAPPPRQSALKSSDPADQASACKHEDNVKSIAGSVPGSSFSRLQVGGNFVGNTMTFGGHQLFLTINPSDVNDLRCYTVAEFVECGDVPDFDENFDFCASAL